MYVCMSVWCVLIKNIIERNAISNLFGFFFPFICDEKEKESCAWKFDEAWRGDSRPSDGDQVTLLFICFSLVELDCTLSSLKCLRDRFNRQYYICSIGHLSGGKCFNL